MDNEDVAQQKASSKTVDLEDEYSTINVQLNSSDDREY